jgi:glycosyltransferase involved in cell wall biosynthesis
MSAPKQSAPRILHCHSAGDASWMQTRCIRVIEALGAEARHALVVEGQAPLAGADRLARKVELSRPSFPSLTGAPWPGRLNRLAAAMAGYDLICTYGAGALDAALAHTLFADVYKLAPLVHQEGAEETGRSSLLRRIALGRTAALVVPTREMERIALERWQQPRSRVRLIPEGVDTAAFAAPPRRDAVPGLVKRRGELWLGTFASAAAEVPGPLLRTVATLPAEWQLVVAAEERSHAAIVAEAARTGIEDRVHPVSAPADSARLIGLFDLFATPQAGPRTMEAMAAGLPVVAPRDSEAGSLLASENGPFLAAPGDEDELAAVIARLAGDKMLRRRIGEANRAKARAEFDEKRMTERMQALYRSLLGQPASVR